MYLIRKVADRQVGMGLKITKYHAITHMAQDILDFGVPMNFGTGSGESGHKAPKTAAKLAQKSKVTFIEQVEKRLSEVHGLDLAMEEIRHERYLWAYFWEKDGLPDHRKMASSAKNSCIKGDRFRFRTEDGQWAMGKMNISKGPSCEKIEGAFAKFMGKLSLLVAEYIPKLEVRTCYTREETIFRGSPMFSGGVWRDWVMVDWGDDGKIPAKIWGFADFSKLPQDNGTTYGGLPPIPPGYYAIVESAPHVHNRAEVNRSPIFAPILKDVGKMVQGRVVDLTFYLADVDAFNQPLVVIPNIGGEPNSYLLMKSRCDWCDEFIRFLRRPHEKWPDFPVGEENTDER
jgi:hypothetical protein